MPVNIITQAQREKYGRYVKAPASEDMAYFHLTEDDHSLISAKRGNHNRIGFALQLTTIRFLGTFLEDPLDVPPNVLSFICGQLEIFDLKNIDTYRFGESRWDHAGEIKKYYGYHDFTETQLNRSEGRHRLAREVFHGKRGEFRQRYRIGQEDQLGALGLVVNVIALWNTIYMDAIINQLKKEGLLINEDDVARLCPLGSEHINVLGRYSFAIPEAVAKGEMRPLHNNSE